MNNKNIMQYNEKNQKHGLWEMYYSNGNLWNKRFYHDGEIVVYGELEYWHDWHNWSDIDKITKKIYNL